MNKPEIIEYKDDPNEPQPFSMTFSIKVFRIVCAFFFIVGFLLGAWIF